MANDVVFTVEGKGKNLKKTADDAGNIGKNVDKSNAALDKAGGKQDAYNRREKGIFQTNLSSGKAYSKLAQNIGGGGSSSLVGAYATLAANVFALTAAFNALRNASQFQQLVAGLESVGDAAGRNLTHLGEKLQEVTGHAISAERAMKAVAIGTSAGFSADQLTKLTTVARGASIALGRDMGDAMDRLIRGAAKLEPEILDELGIMVRLDDATENYAATINKTAGSLTQFERRMAFVTAINEQGLEKFEGIAKAVDPTPYDQLAASLDNLMKTGLSLVNSFLTPMVNLMANSTGVLVGTLTLFGSTISRQMLPFLHDTADNARRAAEEFAKMNSVSRDSIVTTGALPPKYKKLSKSIVDGTASMEEMQVVQKELANSEKHRAGQLKNIDKEQDPAKYAKVSAGLDNVRLAQTELTRVTEGHLGVLARTKAADAMTMTSLSQLPGGWRKLNDAILDNNEQIDLNAEKQGRSVSSMDKASKAAFKYGNRLKFVGATIMRAIPFIGLAITAYGLLSAAWDKFVPGDKMKKATDDALEAFDRIEEITEALAKGTAKATDATVILSNQYRALAGVVATARDVIGSISNAIVQSQMDAVDSLINRIFEIERRIQELNAMDTGNQAHRDRSRRNQAKNLEKSRDELEQDLQRQKDIIGKFDEQALSQVQRGVEMSILKMKAFSKANDGIGAAQIAALKDIERRLDPKAADAIKNQAELNRELDEAARPTAAFDAAVQGASQTMGEFVKASVKLGQGATTPFDEAMKGLQGIGREITSIDDAAKQVYTTKLREMQNSKFAVNRQRAQEIAEISQANEAERLFQILKKNLRLEEELGIETRAQFEAYQRGIEDRVQGLRQQEAVVKRLKSLEKDTASFAKSQFISRELATKETFKSTKARIAAEEKYNQDAQNLNQTLALRGKEERYLELLQKKKAGALGEEAGELAELQEIVKKNVELQAEAVLLADERLKLRLEDKQVALAQAEDAMAALKITEKMIGLERQRSNLLKTQESNQAKLAAMRDPVRRGQGRETLSPAEEYKLFLQRENRERKMLDREHKIKIAMLKAEDTLLKAKVELNKMEAEILRDRKILSAKSPEEIQAAKDQYKAFVQSADDYIKAMSPLLQMRIDVANLENKVARSNLSVEKERLGIAARRGSMSAFESASGDVRQGGGTGIAGVDAAAGLAAHNRERRIAIEAARTKGADDWEESQEEGIKKGLFSPAAIEANRKAAGDAAVIEFKGAESMTEKVQLLRVATEGLNEELRKLGPEGEVAAAVGQGGIVMAQSVANIADTYADGAGKLEAGAAIASAVAATIATTANIMAAASANRIAGIDREIAAEKKRDGKSKQSLAKIKAMEAKKAQMQKKAFEMNKKMQMASIVASTAAAMMSALVSATVYEKPLGFILAGIIGAMGAAQLAIVAGLQYQGGSGGISAPSGPSNISMGERNNKVDIAGGRANTAGEMSYLRGDRGFGTGAADFRPAFAGRKYRAAGGAAYVVGEQGPELFVPSVPGRVVSNDDMEAGSAVGNVNFTINAIDAAGVEEVLVEQRGNIIGMLRESANEYGTGFLEEVNEDAYTSTTEGSVYGRA